MGDQDDIQDMYVYDLPYMERNELCSILDINNQWEILGGKYMGFRKNDLERFRRAGWCEKSPTDRMLQEWGQQNNTILELFFFLHKMGHYQAMSAIKSCVPAKYHIFCNHKERFRSSFENEGFVEASPKTKASERASADHMDNHNGLAVVATAVDKGGPAQHLPMAEAEGAIALPPTAASKYGSENLNKMTAPRGQLASKKVPEDMLRPPLHAAPDSVKPKSISPQYGRQDIMLGNSSETKKILNNKHSGGTTKVSCEDNNQQDLESTRSKGLSYHASQDYKRMAEKKLAEIEAADAGRETSHQQQGTPVTHQYPPVGCRPFPNTSVASDIPKHSECVLPMIPYKELEDATACWSKDNFLGRGGFGVVFKGKWKNSEVAIKKIFQHENANNNKVGESEITEALGELKLCLSHQHDNILQVYGYSADAGLPPCIVYQFMPNGSLEDRLLLRKLEGASSNNWAPLTWTQRFVIALGTAKALQFLHTVNKKPLIHGDVKSANILLDKHLEPKLGDFGLAREGKSQSTSLKVTRINGTRAYLPNDFLRSKKLSVKVDTYSYGIVLFELCTGLRALDEKKEEDTKYLKDLVEKTPASEKEKLRDPNTGKDDVYGIFVTLLSIAKRCVRPFASRRPEMAEVFNDLEKHQSYIWSNWQAASSSPYHLQLQHDMTVKSNMTPGKLTSQSSIPLTMHPPSQSLTLKQPPSIPPPIPNSSNHHNYPIHPQDGFRFGYLPPRQYCWKQGNRDAYHYGIGNPALEGRPVLNPLALNVAVIPEPPPTYYEAVSPNGCSPLGGNNGHVNMIPDFEVLHIGTASQNLPNHPTSNRFTQGIVNSEKEGGSNIPLLSLLGQSTAPSNKSEPSRPSAANKKSVFHGNDDDDDDDEDDDDDDDDD
ncbi:uncharacterized protein [Palaemon carinicauda]|uniref:uncharacterized protein n=1 Tax=Palaemon carinicauda TaxID=392227 RepID=UPI0035B655D1